MADWVPGAFSSCNHVDKGDVSLWRVLGIVSKVMESLPKSSMFDVESERKPAIAVHSKHWCLWLQLCPIPRQLASRSCSAAASRLVDWNPRDNQIKVGVESHFAWSAALGVGEHAWTAFLGNIWKPPTGFRLAKKDKSHWVESSLVQGFHNHRTFSSGIKSTRKLRFVHLIP